MARKIRNENPTPKSHADCVANLQEEIADVELCISVFTRCTARPRRGRQDDGRKASAVE